jgi:HD-GYP domain-containing protein (c-di-GMP phosphodiesterase class II)
VEELRRGSGTQFDPAVLDALLRVLAAQVGEPVPA